MAEPVINDAALDPVLITEVADRIRVEYVFWITHRSTGPSWERDDAVPLHLLRQGLRGDPSEYVDAALRHLDSQQIAEVSPMSDPSEDDEAAAVWLVRGDAYEDQGWAHQIAFV